MRKIVFWMAEGGDDRIQVILTHPHSALVTFEFWFCTTVALLEAD
jgi:hypothetical protein